MGCARTACRDGERDCSISGRTALPIWSWMNEVEAILMQSFRKSARRNASTPVDRPFRRASLVLSARRSVHLARVIVTPPALQWSSGRTVSAGADVSDRRSQI